MTIDELGQLAATVSTLLGHPEGAVALSLIGDIVQAMHSEQREHTTPEELAAVQDRVRAARARAEAADS